MCARQTQIVAPSRFCYPPRPYAISLFQPRLPLLMCPLPVLRSYFACARHVSAQWNRLCNCIAELCLTARCGQVPEPGSHGPTATSSSRSPTAAPADHLRRRFALALTQHPAPTLAAALRFSKRLDACVVVTYEDHMRVSVACLSLASQVS